MTGRLSTFFAIRPGEGRLVGLLFAHSLLNGWAQTATLSVAYSLFVSAFGAQNLAYRYIGTAIVTMLAGFLYGWLAGRMRFATLLSTNLAVLGLGLCAFRLLLELPEHAWAIAALSVWYGLLTVFPDVEFWSLAGRLLDVRQAKRLYQPVGLGTVVSMVVGGLSMPLLVSLIGTWNLLLTAAAGLGGSLVLMRLLATQNADRMEVVTRKEVSKQKQAKQGGGLRQLAGNRYILLIFLFVGLYELVNLFTDNIFVASAAGQFPTTDQLAGFLGVFGALTGVLGIIVRSLGTASLLARFGLVGALIALPLAVGSGSAAMAAIGLVGGSAGAFFWAASFTKFSERVFKRSTHQSGNQMLYQPLPPMQRLRVQSTAETVIDSIGLGLGGVALLVLLNVLHLNAAELALILLLIVAALGVTAFVLGRAYPRALFDALDKKRLSGADLLLSDRASIAVLEKGLQSPKPVVVLAALDLLERADAGRLATAVPPLLAHESIDVRLAALSLAERLRLDAVLPLVREQLASGDDARLRAGAVRALAALGGPAVTTEFAALLDDPVPEVRVAACAALLREENNKQAPGRSRLRAWGAAQDPGMRMMAAQALGQACRGDLYTELLPLLRDSGPQVRAAALMAAGELKQPELWPDVLAALNHGLTSQATAALVAAGDVALPAVRAGLTDPALGRAAQIALARVCTRIDSNAAREVLAAQIGHHDDEVRTQVMQALARWGYQAAGPEADFARRQIRNEVAAAARYCRALVDLEHVEEATLLSEALDHRVVQARERVLLLLALVYNGPTVLRARHNLRDASSQKRAYALEVLELQTEPQLRQLVFPLLEDLPPAARLRRLPALMVGPPLSAIQRLERIAVGDPWAVPWLRACAANALTRLPTAPASLMPGAEPEEVQGQLSTLVGKVAALQKVDIFAAVPGEALAELAWGLDWVALPSTQQLFAKGERGACLYIITSGRIRIHDGQSTLNELDAGQVFGEMALLDGSPRSAAATALADTTLLRLDQEPFFGILTARSEVLRGVMHVLSARLRARVQDLVELQARTPDLRLPNI